jgi:hypothetical protein
LKDLPKVFANPLDGKFNNNRTFSYGRLENPKKVRNEKEVTSKIESIFKDSSIVNCIITFENTEEKYSIIGKTSNNLVTKSQKLIPIRDIYDIEVIK